MKNMNRQLLIDHLDKKLAMLQGLADSEIPTKGWINAVRTTLGMTLAQLAKRLNKTPVAVREIEGREQSKTITLKKLIEVGEALDLRFVYGFVPKESSLRAMIEKRAREVAHEIVMRTSHSMALEDQKNSEERLEQSIRDLAEMLKRELPRHLWD